MDEGLAKECDLDDLHGGKGMAMGGEKQESLEEEMRRRWRSPLGTWRGKGGAGKTMARRCSAREEYEWEEVNL